jgi:hypothetical protein
MEGNRRLMAGREGSELRAWKNVLLVFTVQAGYSGRQSALPRFAEPAVGKALPFFPAGL